MLTEQCLFVRHLTTCFLFTSHPWKIFTVSRDNSRVYMSPRKNRSCRRKRHSPGTREKRSRRRSQAVQLSQRRKEGNGLTKAPASQGKKHVSPESGKLHLLPQRVESVLSDTLHYSPYRCPSYTVLPCSLSPSLSVSSMFYSI